MFRIKYGPTAVLTSSLLLGACPSSGAKPHASDAPASPPPAAGAQAAPVAGMADAPKPAGSPAADGGKGGSTPSPAPAGTGGSTPGTTAPTQIQRSSVGPNTAPSVPDADYKTFIANINNFGLELGQKLASDDKIKKENLIYSPLSVTIALGMTYAGAKGSTATELKTALGDSFASGVFHTATNRLSRELASRRTSRSDADGNAHKVELNVVDAIFVDQSTTLQMPFLDLMSREYDSGVRRLDFVHAFEPARMTINGWVEEQTKNKIEDLLQPGTISDMTRVVLVNAIYFYATWQAPFSPDFTKDKPFKTLGGQSAQVPTMGGQLNLAYRAADKFEVAELPYEGNQLRMTIVLPAEGQFEAVRSQISAAWLDQAVAGLQPALLQVSLPKFKLTGGPFKLIESLKALGIQKLFADADLSGIATIPLTVSEVVQKAFIAVDENGAEAGAATAVVTGPPSAPATIPFVVDRPFLFFIRDSNGAVLFSGHVVSPAQ